MIEDIDLISPIERAIDHGAYAEALAMLTIVKPIWHEIECGQIAIRFEEKIITALFRDLFEV